MIVFSCVQALNSVKMARVILFLFCYFALLLQSASSEEEIIKGNIASFCKKCITMGDSQSEFNVRDSRCYTCANKMINSDILIKSMYVNLSGIPSGRIYVDVEAEFKLCIGDKGERDQPCYSNYLEVYVYRGQIEPNFPSPTDKEAVKNYLLNNFSPVYNITSTMSLKATNKTENHTFTFHRNKSKGITFGIRSRGACVDIHRMKMYYYYCEKTCKNGVVYAKTISPADGSKQVPGNCPKNPSPKSTDKKISLDGSCSSNGTWFIPDTVNCHCNQGYSSERGGCQCKHLPKTGQNGSSRKRRSLWRIKKLE